MATSTKVKKPRKASAYSKRVGKYMRQGKTMKQAHQLAGGAAPKRRSRVRRAASRARPRRRRNTKTQVKTVARRRYGRSRPKRSRKRNSSAIYAGKLLIGALAYSQIAPTSFVRLINGNFSGAISGIGSDLTQLPQSPERAAKAAVVLVGGSMVRRAIPARDRQIIKVGGMSLNV